MKKLRIHCIQHVHFEGPAMIKSWADQGGHAFSFTRLFESGKYPALESIDWLIIMGGPMGVNEHEKHPWLDDEINYIKKAIDDSKIVIGICLGAQLIAKALGAEVMHGGKKEIGWFPVRFDKKTALSAGFDFLPEEITVLHWHGDTFTLPEGALHLASSKAFLNQAFLYKNNVLALQFHFEMNASALDAILNHSANEIVPGSFVQDAQTISSNRILLHENNNMMRKILGKFEAETPKQ
jgi:GMP synthase-like glutamine amidotransferase